jgi:hypothetical protein
LLTTAEFQVKIDNGYRRKILTECRGIPHPAKSEDGDE